MIDEDVIWVIQKMQPIAIEQVYSKVWPQCSIHSLDDDQTNRLKVVLDVSGADKLLIWPNGTTSFLGQRFRRPHCGFDDFTLRLKRRSGYEAEAYKVLDALRENKNLAAYYAYGHVNQNEDGFKRFRILNFRKFLSMWKAKEIPAPAARMCNDGSSHFLAWPFESIPTACIYWQLLPEYETNHWKRRN